MLYTVKVPTTHDQGSYTTIARDDFQSVAQDALQDYNSARAHDGLPPLRRMPKGTTYSRVMEYVLYADYGQGWEEETIEKTHREIIARLHEYRENAPQYAYKWRSRPAQG